MLRIILGISGSGKSSKILEEIKFRAKNGKKSLLIVPEQFTSSTEKRIFSVLGNSLSGYVESYSFSSFSEHILQQYGGAAIPTLSEAGRAVLVKRAIESLGDKVVYYSRHRKKITFCQMAAETINELKSAGLDGQLLAELASKIDDQNGKLNELSLILSSYEALLANNAMDPGDRVKLAAEQLQPDGLSDTSVFVDEFDTFNVPKRILLRRLMEVTDVTVALCADSLDDYDHGTGLFSGAKDVASELCRLAHQAGVSVQKPILMKKDLRHAEGSALQLLNQILIDNECVSVSQKGEITLYKATDRDDEIRMVAAAIRHNVEHGVPYGKMAVICRNAKDYLSSVQYRFEMADIPLFFDEPVTPENTAPARAIKAAIEILRRGISTDSVLGLIKTGLCKISESEQCALENYAYTWKLTTSDWCTPFTRAPSGYDGDPEHNDDEILRLAEDARLNVIPAVEEYIKCAKNKKAMEISRQIYFLLIKLGADSCLNELSYKLKLERGIPAAEKVIREWNIAVDLLNQIGLLLGEDKITAAEYSEIFTLLLRSSDVGNIPEMQNSVIFTTAGRMRLDDIQVCFILGLSEGKFPELPGETGLLTHRDRDSLIQSGIKMPDCFENRLIREKICFYKALTVAKKKIWLSWPGGNGGTELSNALSNVIASFSPQPPVIDILDLTGTPAMAIDELGRRWFDTDSEIAATLYEALQQNSESARQLKTIHQTVIQNEPVVTRKKELEQIIGKSLRISPSKVEKFYTCRFAYFLQYVLHVRPRHKAELSPNQSGSLVHWVLEKSLRRYPGQEFCILQPAQIHTLASTLTDEYVSQNMPNQSERFCYLLDRLKTTIAELLLYLQKDISQSQFEPVSFEQTIGNDEGAIQPVSLQTQDGHQIKVIGTIDRVDAFRRGEQTWIRVVDYKTGDKNFKLDEVYCGLDCQMLLYLFTLTRNGKNIFHNPAPAGVLYLMADPAPKLQLRDEAEKEKVFRLDGILIDDISVLHAMDKDCKGLFIPLSFNKDGSPRTSKKLADLSKLGRIQEHIDKLIVDMASELFNGKIDAEPLCPAGKCPCDYCDYITVCRHESGMNEKSVFMPENYFDRDQGKEESK